LEGLPRGPAVAGHHHLMPPAVEGHFDHPAGDLVILGNQDTHTFTPSALPPISVPNDETSSEEPGGHCRAAFTGGCAAECLVMKANTACVTGSSALTALTMMLRWSRSLTLTVVASTLTSRRALPIR